MYGTDVSALELAIVTNKVALLSWKNTVCNDIQYNIIHLMSK